MHISTLVLESYSDLFYRFIFSPVIPKMSVSCVSFRSNKP